MRDLLTSIIRTSKAWIALSTPFLRLSFINLSIGNFKKSGFHYQEQRISFRRLVLMKIEVLRRQKSRWFYHLTEGRQYQWVQPLALSSSFSLAFLLFLLK